MEGNEKDCCATKHLCDLMADKDAFQAVKEAAKKARFICKACGRAAAKQESLCDPVSLDA